MSTKLVNRISRSHSLKEAIAFILQSADRSDGLLQLTSKEFVGRVIIKNGRYIVGAEIKSSTTSMAQTGRAALGLLFAIEKAELQFEPTTEKVEDVSNGLQIDLYTLEGLPDVGRTIDAEPSPEDTMPPVDDFRILAEGDPVVSALDQTVSALTENQIKLLRKLSQLTSDVDKKAFLAENPSFTTLRQFESLSDKQLKLLETYKKLNGDRDKTQFLAINGAFADFMESTLSAESRAALKNSRERYIDACINVYLQKDGTAKKISPDQIMLLRAKFDRMLSEQDRKDFLDRHPEFEQMSRDLLNEEQTRDLEHARLGNLEEFDQFKARYAGEGELTDAQLNKLREVYSDLATEENRRLFMAACPNLILEEVERGEELWLEEMSERKRLFDEVHNFEPTPRDHDDNALLHPIDMGYRLPGAEKEDKKDHIPGFVEISKIKPRPWYGDAQTLGWSVVAVAVSACVIGGSYLQMQKHNEIHQPAAIIVDEEEKDGELLKPTIKYNIRKDMPSAFANTYHAQGSSSGADGSSSGEAPAYQNVQMVLAIQKGNRLLAEGHYESAIEILAPVLDEDPDNSMVRVSLIRAYMALKNNPKARQLAIAGVKRARTREERMMFQRLLIQVLSD